MGTATDPPQDELLTYAVHSAEDKGAWKATTPLTTKENNLRKKERRFSDKNTCLCYSLCLLLLDSLSKFLFYWVDILNSLGSVNKTLKIHVKE